MSDRMAIFINSLLNGNKMNREINKQNNTSVFSDKFIILLIILMLLLLIYVFLQYMKLIENNNYKMYLINKL